MYAYQGNHNSTAGKQIDKGVVLISPKRFCDYLEKNGLTFFVGVPDSLLKNFCAYLSDSSKDLIAANEGNAISIALGYHLATGKIGVCYMQNSGLGNATNPLVSLVHPDIYSVPMLLIIGWRGRPGVKDEPQHIAQGRITTDLLNTLEIKNSILPEDSDEAEKATDRAVEYMQTEQAPYAFVVKKGTFKKYQIKNTIPDIYSVSREDALKTIVPLLGNKDMIVSTTGKLSRELFELREARGENHGSDFLTVGGMGHASSIALGIALQKPGRNVYCFDGDGAAIMHMGAQAIIGSNKPENFRHVVFNNGAHDSVGGQPTVGFNIDLPTIAKANGYNIAQRAETVEEISAKFGQLRLSQGPALLEIRVKKGARSDLGRPTTTPVQNKNEFKKSVISDK